MFFSQGHLWPDKKKKINFSTFSTQVHESSHKWTWSLFGQTSKAFSEKHFSQNSLQKSTSGELIVFDQSFYKCFWVLNYKKMTALRFILINIIE